MRATINGITIEGTAQEIAEYMRLMDEQDRAKRSVPIAPSIPQWGPYRPEITCADGWINCGMTAPVSPNDYALY
jgi:hypothetical protein